eukprot:tig00020553_g10554.t1
MAATSPRGPTPIHPANEDEDPQHISTGTDGSPYLHVIDSDGAYTPRLEEFLQLAGILNRGDEFSVLAIMGCQSGGKSTLMNRLFGTEFRVMNPDVRSQTTRGVWMAGTKTDASAIVMDLEGSDSRERGEAGVAYERKIALFALAIADVLMVNMWNQDVGRRDAANYGLLRTVLEINLHLFHRDRSSGRKQLLMFVIRDHLRPPLSELEGILRKDLAAIWGNLSKPAGLESSTVDDFFDLDFVSLPHKVYEEEAFEKGIASLKKRFSDRSDPGYVLKGRQKKEVPADGFSHYVGSIWDAIRENKDLDLPGQREMVAQFRCGEIAKAALESFRAAAAPLFEEAARGEPVPGAGARAGELLAAAAKEYAAGAQKYQYAKRAFEEVASDLRAKALQEVEAKCMKPQGALLRERAQRGVVARVDALVPAKVDAKSLPDLARFGARAAEARRAVREELAASLEELAVDGAAWSGAEEAAAAVEAAGEGRARDAAEKLAGRAVDYVTKAMATGIQEAAAPLLERADPRTMWRALREVVASAQEKSRGTLASILTGLGVSGAAAEGPLAELGPAAESALRDKVAAVAAPDVFLSKMAGRFAERFRKDDRKLPRVFKGPADVDAAFVPARRAALEMLDLFCVLRLEKEADEKPEEGPDTPAGPAGAAGPADLAAVPDSDPYAGAEAGLHLIKPEARAALRERFLRDAEASFQEAHRALADPLAALRGVPLWVFGLLLLFGADEILWLLRNPLLFLAVAAAAAAAFVFRSETARGVALASARAGSAQLLNTAKSSEYGKKVGALLEKVPRAPAPAAASNSTSAPEAAPAPK